MPTKNRSKVATAIIKEFNYRSLLLYVIFSRLCHVRENFLPA
jgi:hypothetical protein